MAMLPPSLSQFFSHVPLGIKDQLPSARIQVGNPRCGEEVERAWAPPPTQPALEQQRLRSPKVTRGGARTCADAGEAAQGGFRPCECVRGRLCVSAFLDMCARVRGCLGGMDSEQRAWCTPESGVGGGLRASGASGLKIRGAFSIFCEFKVETPSPLIKYPLPACPPTKADAVKGCRDLSGKRPSSLPRSSGFPYLELRFLRCWTPSSPATLLEGDSGTNTKRDDGFTQTELMGFLLGKSSH
ncbi:uncharacterized protein LOC144581535 [Callithrix jacchus]